MFPITFTIVFRVYYKKRNTNKKKQKMKWLTWSSLNDFLDDSFSSSNTFLISALKNWQFSLLYNECKNNPVSNWNWYCNNTTHWFCCLETKLVWTLHLWKCIRHPHSTTNRTPCPYKHWVKKKKKFFCNTVKFVTTIACG